MDPVDPTDPAAPPARDGGPAMPESLYVVVRQDGVVVRGKENPLLVSCTDRRSWAARFAANLLRPGTVAEYVPASHRERADRLEAEVDRLKRRYVAEKDSHDRDGKALMRLNGELLRTKQQAHKLRKALDALLELCVRPDEDEQGEWYYFTDLDVTAWNDEGESIERPTWKTQAEAFRAILAQIHCAELAEGIDAPS